LTQFGGYVWVGGYLRTVKRIVPRGSLCQQWELGWRMERVEARGRTRESEDAGLEAKSSGGSAIPLRAKRASPPKPSPEEVARLVAAAQRNDREAFGQIYRIYYRPIYNLARFYFPQEADDIVAETFVRAWGAIVRYRDTGPPFVTWLYGIARHIVADERRSRQRVEPRSEVPDSLTEMEQDDRIMLAMGLQRLPAGQRRVLELRYLLDLSHAEIAALLRKSVGAVKAQRWRALQNLSTILRKQ
jgi:RNA polymerase sigma-70 factor (ECF subfamily)